MADTLVDKYDIGQPGKKEADAGFALDDRPQDYTAFSIDMQVRPSNALIDFWMANGDQHAIAYNHLYDVQWQRSDGLQLTFSDHLVIIRGHRLDRLYRGLKRHRVVFIWAASEQEARLADEDEELVTAIAIQPRHQSFEIQQ